MGFLTKTLPILSACIVFTISIQFIKRRQQKGLKYEGDLYSKGGRDLLDIKNPKRIIHVVSPYKPSRCKEPFCPFDQTQSIVIASMIRAKEKSRSPVTLAAATFPEDRVVVPPEFVLLPPLKRDSKSAYPTVPYMKKMPFFQDIFDLIIDSPFEYDFVVYTNSDIILHEDFYNIVQEQIEQGYDAFTINRQVIPAERKINGFEVKYTSLDLDEIYKTRGSNHPGFDCFIIKKEILSQIRMGDMFLGAPPVAQTLLSQIDLLATSKKYFHSKDLKATWHLGNDRKAKMIQMRPVYQQNVKNALCTLPHLIEECISEEHMTCGGLLRFIKNWWDKRITFEQRELWCGENVIENVA